MSAPYSEFVHSFFHSFISSFFPFCQPAFLPFLVIDHLSPQLHPFLLFFNSIFSLSFQSKLTNSHREGSRAQHHPFFLHPIHLYFLFFLPTLHHSVTPSFLLLSILLFFLHCSHPILSFIRSFVAFFQFLISITFSLPFSILYHPFSPFPFLKFSALLLPQFLLLSLLTVSFYFVLS